MASQKDKPSTQLRHRKKELARLLNDYLREIGCSKTEIIHTMRPLRQVVESSEHPAGKYFIRVAGGSITPDFDYLLEIVAAINARAGRELGANEVALWLTSWLGDYLQKYPKPPRYQDRDSKKLAQAKHAAAASFISYAVSAVESWRQKADTGRYVDRHYPPTLRDKGYILNNCVVIVGASVRYPPSSTEQLFRQNAQLSDLMYLPNLDLGPEPLLLTDNMIIALADEDRKLLLGNKHLLVIGGPVVNVATRYLNNRSIFPFCFDERKRKFDEVFDTLKGYSSLRSSQAVEQFYLMLQRPAADIKLDSRPFTGRNVSKVKEDADKFRRDFELEEDTVYDDVIGWLTGLNSFFDPIARNEVKPSRTEPNLGVVSLGKNHWADDPHYVCVTVAGLNPFGTVGALRALVYSKFIDRPCGGILNAALPQNPSEYFRFIDADFDWVTEQYSVADLKAHLARIHKDNRRGRPAFHAFHGAHDYFNDYAKFVRSFAD